MIRIFQKDIFIYLIKEFYLLLFLVSRLMGGSASSSMGHMSNMGTLAACSVTDTKPMQFPLAQRRKRRVLFTQAQVCQLFMYITLFCAVGKENRI